jgi:hypothetical protein
MKLDPQKTNDKDFPESPPCASMFSNFSPVFLAMTIRPRPRPHLWLWGPAPICADGTEKTWLFGLSGNSKAGNYCRTFKGVLWDTVILYYGICHMICHAMAAIYGCHNNINIYYHCTWFDRTLKTCDLAIISSPHGEHSPRTPGYVSVWWGSDLPTATRGWKWFFLNHLILGLWQSILLMGETFSKDLGPLGLGGTQHISASPHRTMMVFGRKTNLLRWFRFVGEKSTCCLYPQFIKSTFLYVSCLSGCSLLWVVWCSLHGVAQDFWVYLLKWLHMDSPHISINHDIITMIIHNSTNRGQSSRIRNN